MSLYSIRDHVLELRKEAFTVALLCVSLLALRVPNKPDKWWLKLRHNTALGVHALFVLYLCCRMSYSNRTIIPECCTCLSCISTLYIDPSMCDITLGDCLHQQTVLQGATYRTWMSGMFTVPNALVIVIFSGRVYDQG